MTKAKSLGPSIVAVVSCVRCSTQSERLTSRTFGLLVEELLIRGWTVCGDGYLCERCDTVRTTAEGGRLMRAEDAR